MASITDLERVLHYIQVKLYPNYLPKVNGKFLARTANNKVLSVEDICTTLKTRAEFSGKYETLLENVKQYLDEVAYQLCDGFAVNNGYYSVYPNIGGTFNSTHDTCDREKHPISFRFGTRAKLRKLTKNIDVVIDGMADVLGYIAEFINTEDDSINTMYIPGDIFTINGYKIKVWGDDPSCGVYFVPVEDPSKAVKVKRLPHNTGTKIIGVCPQTEYNLVKIEIRSQYTGSSKCLLKAPRIITSDFILEEG